MMRGLDIMIVRLLPFFLFIDLGRIIYNSWNGINFYPYNLLHSNSAIYATALFFISLANHHYHCKWNRAMYVFLIVTPLINYIDNKVNLFNSVENYLWFITLFFIFTAILTAYLAIKHFLPAQKSIQNE